MATFPGQLAVAPALLVSDPSGTITPPGMLPMPFTPTDAVGVGTLVDVANLPAVVVTTFQGEIAYQATGTYEWFEHFHVVPRAFDFGNLLSAQSTPIEVFSAWRRETKSWTGFVNNAGEGVELGGEPSLAASFAPMTGIEMTLDVSPLGPPLVDEFLEFEFDGLTIFVRIEIQRIVLWWPVPELPTVEVLRFKTNIIGPAIDGSEQRVSVRKCPRRVFRYRYEVDEGLTRQRLENLLFDWQAQTFGVPVWIDDTYLTSAATAGDFTINVASTAWRDFRVGGLAVILEDGQTFDVLEIDSFDATSITFTTALVGSYAANIEVFPLLTCNATPVVQGGRHAVNRGEMQIEFTSTANDVDLADVSAFDTFNSKVLLDVGNVMGGELVPETFEKDIEVLDSETGIVALVSSWSRHKRGHRFTMRAAGRQELWEMRGLIYALDGRRVSFYVPRASDDLVPVANLASAGVALQVSNVGYAQFVRHRQPKNVIRVVRNDGGASVIRTVIDSENIDADTDELTVDSGWPATITPAQVARIEYVEKVRLDTDDVEILHELGGSRSYMAVPLKAVFE